MTITATNTVLFGAFEIFEQTNKRAPILSLLRDWNDRRTTRKAMARLSVSQMEDIGMTAGYPVAEPMHIGRA